MKPLTKSDLINIESLKGVLKMINNDIKDLKTSPTAPSEKTSKLITLHRQRAQIVSQGNSKYPHINWLDEAVGPDNGFNRSLIDTARMKIEMKFNFN